jgi:hypothetical protein
MADVEPKELSILGGGNEISQFFSMGKIGIECVDKVQSQPKNTTSPTCEKVVKKTPPPLSVDGEDWLILQPRASPMKRLFK